MEFWDEEEIGNTVSRAKPWFDRSTQRTAVRNSKGKLTSWDGRRAPLEKEGVAVGNAIEITIDAEAIQER